MIDTLRWQPALGLAVSAPPNRPAMPHCAQDAGTWCAKVYGWTHNDVLARSADAVVDRGLDIVLILALAIIARSLLHRTVDRLVAGATNGPSLVAAALRRHTPSRLKAMATPLLSERRVQRATTIGSVLRSITSVVVLVVAAIMVMAEFGLNLAPVLASAGIVGVAIGFGAQNLVRDFLSGMFMLLEDQYGVGDVIDLGQATGTVEAVGLRITTLRDGHGTVWFVPNGTITRVGNKSQGYAVAVVDIPLAHHADITMAIEVAGREADEVAASDEVAGLLLEPPKVLGVDSVSIEGIVLRVTAKVAPGQQWAVQRALNAGITHAFDRAALPRPSASPSPKPANGEAANNSGSRN
jgi:small conductance mechanosensitive channel